MVAEGNEASAFHVRCQGLDVLLDRLTARAQEVLHARDVALRLLQPDGTLRTVMARGKYAELLVNDVVYPGKGITYSVFQTGVAEVVNNPWEDPRVATVEGSEEDETKAIRAPQYPVPE